MLNKIIYKTLRRLLKAGEDTIPKLYLRLLLPEAPVIVDAGAHVGDDTREMSRLWPRGTIHAFEPVPGLFQRLTENTAGLGNVCRYQLALGEDVGTAEMFVSGGGSDASSSLLLPKEVLQINPHVLFGGRITVPTSTLDAWAQENGISKIDFLWLDMQGAELAMLEAAPRSLAGVQAIHLEVSLVELYASNPLYSQVRAWLESRGFRREAEEIVQSPSGTAVGETRCSFGQASAFTFPFFCGCCLTRQGDRLPVRKHDEKTMIRVKLTTNFPEWPLIRQTPGRMGVWGDCRFFINEAVEECDYWVVYDDMVRPEATRCAPENTLLITGEPPSVKTYPARYTAQFAHVLTCQRAIKHPDTLFRQQALPWMVGCRYLKETGLWSEDYTKDYDELTALPAAPKTKQLSVISSDKTISPGHQQRRGFVQRLQEHFGDDIDVYGRGLRDFEDKWDVLAPYKYHVALENGEFPDYWTEKLSDALFADTYPFYGGCPNIGDYFSASVLTRLDLSDAAEAIRVIEQGMAEDRYEATVTARREAAARLLNEYNLFPTLEKIILDTRRALPARPFHIRPQSAFTGTLPTRITGRVRRLLGRSGRWS